MQASERWFVEGVENKSLEQNQLPVIVYDPRVSHDFLGHKMSIK